MELYVFGLNHTTAPLAIRERWAFSEDESRLTLERMRGETAAEHLILSTCNRTEFYSHVPQERSPIGKVTDSLTQRSVLARFYHEYRLRRRGGGPHDRPALPSGDPSHFYLHRRQDAVEHLFRLAGGLDSMIVGESEILRQIKDAFAVAQESQAAGKLFRELFPAALKVGKKVRTVTGISRGCITAGQAALRLAQPELGDFAHHSVLLVGSGEIAMQTAGAFLEHGIRNFRIANRTRKKALKLVEKLGLAGDQFGADVTGDSPDMTVEWSNLKEALVESSLVISSTGATVALVTGEMMREVQSRRGHRSLVVIDLSIPRDFEPAVEKVPGVRLFNIDDLNQVIQENITRRHSHIARAEDIVRQQLRVFYGRMIYSQVDPVIRHLIERFEEIRLGELQATVDCFPPECYGALDQLTRSLVKKLLHFPIERLKSLRDMDSLNDTEVAFLKRLFLTEP